MSVDARQRVRRQTVRTHLQTPCNLFAMLCIIVRHHGACSIHTNHIQSCVIHPTTLYMITPAHITLSFVENVHFFANILQQCCSSVDDDMSWLRCCHAHVSCVNRCAYTSTTLCHYRERHRTHDGLPKPANKRNVVKQHHVLK